MYLNELNEYIKFVDDRRNKNINLNLEVVDYALGLVGESAEVSELIKKWFFHGHALDMEKFIEELGDNFFYFIALLKIFDIKLEDVISKNMDKLSKRYPEGFSSEDSIKRVDKIQE